MANQVTYHLPDGRKPWVLTVLKKNADGTLDLAGEDGQLKVGKCPVSAVPLAGHCTLEVAPAAADVSADKNDTGDSDGDNAALALKTKKDLIELIEGLNAEPERQEKIPLTGKENKEQLLALIAAATKPATA